MKNQNFRVLDEKGTTNNKFYNRPNEEICREICEEITLHPSLDGRGVEVNVADGVVNLRGTVKKKTDKKLVKDLAARISGVRKVENQLRIELRKSRQ